MEHKEVGSLCLSAAAMLDPVYLLEIMNVAVIWQDEEAGRRVAAQSYMYASLALAYGEPE